MASGTATVKADIGLNVRKGPGTSYAKIGALSNGARVNYSSEKNGWLQINYGGKTGYISKQYTSVTSGQTTSSGSKTSSSAGNVRVTAGAGLNVRKGPGTSYAKLGCLAYNTVVSYTGEQNGWLKISYQGKTGYISKQYTTSTTNAPSSSTGATKGSANAQKAVAFANSKVGSHSYKRGNMTYCQGFVADCIQKGLGRSYGRASSAEEARRRWEVGTSMSSIPLGAAVYFHSYTTNGKLYGHVGIHVGGNMICHVTSTNGVVKQSLSSLHAAKWCDFRSWGWEGGISLK